MGRRKNQSTDRLLTEVELELMRIIWERGESTVKEVLDSLPVRRELAYTSVATIMKILEKKGVLASRPSLLENDRAHVYYPLLSKSTYESKSLNHLVDNLFDGAPSSLVVKLLNESDLSSEELKSIRTVLNDLSKKVNS